MEKKWRQIFQFYVPSAFTAPASNFSKSFKEYFPSEKLLDKFQLMVIIVTVEPEKFFHFLILTFLYWFVYF